MRATIAPARDGAVTETDGGLAADAHVERRPAIEGLLRPESVRRTILARLGEVAECHSNALLEYPPAEGRIVVRFVVGPTGAVIAATVRSSTSPSRYVQQCLVNAIRYWVFDAPEGGGIVTIAYPFTLLPPTEQPDETQ